MIIQESNLYEWNARNQITLWGPKGEIIDYANKQWAGKLYQGSFLLQSENIFHCFPGVVSQYFKPRWELFIDNLNTSLIGGKPFNQTDFNTLVFDQVEEPFTFNTNVFPQTVQGNKNCCN